jgi:hypothetical protein
MGNACFLACPEHGFAAFGRLVRSSYCIGHATLLKRLQRFVNLLMASRGYTLSFWLTARGFRVWPPLRCPFAGARSTTS